MHKAIQTRRESVRGCGWRKPGGMYLVSSGDATGCGRLPIPCETCPCCGRGMVPARGWTWVKADELIRAAPNKCEMAKTKHCVEVCVINQVITGRETIGLAGLIWVGHRHYPTINHFNREADRIGISRRINFVPKEFKLGETYVLLAHRKAIIEGELAIGAEPVFKPGIFRLFKPEDVEIVVTGEERDSVIDSYVKRGLTPVMIERIEDTQEELIE
ncbi:hypothetical protein LCGC14_1692510 [marine sediment metagenome]|uniref:Uncharacterized protein n=1 Tax=marine sediment metagenome TaxID=412755 RepID=A0A0F9I7Z9_9ZZZZ